jgi:acetolactate synthase-1/2/3 large subunit
MSAGNGGAIIAEVLARRGVRFLFSLCGGHISPILVGARARGIAVVDTRDEASAVFAADAVARLTGIPGVAAVTAGPGVTNAITAIKNAQMAESPILVLGGATATILKGRGSLQDIDQISLLRSTTKWLASVRLLADLGPTVERALTVAASGVPGPVFVEVPVDLLYPESLVREWYMKESGAGNAKNLGGKALALYLRGHLYRQFHAPRIAVADLVPEVRLPPAGSPRRAVARAAERLRRAKRPVLVVGSQALVNADLRRAQAIASAVDSLGVPTFLAGMARGLLGRNSNLQFRHARAKALKEADVVLVAGAPFDFRLGYGRGFSSKATVAAANLSAAALRKNRRPQIAARMHPGNFLQDLAGALGGRPGTWEDWFATLRGRESQREEEIARRAEEQTDLVNPIRFLRRLEEKVADDAILVADGGDFVATASYILRPRGPLAWLDPGAFGTLGVGGGFALGAALCRPGAEVWILYGDGSCAYSLAEFDTFVRHGVAPIAVVGTDGSWAQIAREQVEILKDDVGTVLRRTDYDRVAQGYGGVGLRLDDPARIDEVLDEAKAHARAGRPVLVNVHIARTDFRKGSISM